MNERGVTEGERKTDNKHQNITNNTGTEAIGTELGHTRL